MYDLIENLISHTWQTNYTGDQQYIYYIAGTVIVIMVIMVFDLIKTLIFSAAGKR